MGNTPTSEDTKPEPTQNKRGRPASVVKPSSKGANTPSSEEKPSLKAVSKKQKHSISKKFTKAHPGVEDKKVFDLIPKPNSLKTGSTRPNRAKANIPVIFLEATAEVHSDIHEQQTIQKIATKRPKIKGKNKANSPRGKHGSKTQSRRSARLGK